MSEFDIRPLSPDTWPPYAELIERHNGVWNGCWCMPFHDAAARKSTPERNREAKLARVRSGDAHASLVFDGGRCVGWCQFGSVAELPCIKHRKAYDAGLEELPDWRITCFFVDRGYRRRGVADLALGGAIDQIAILGGGVVESYPEVVSGRKVSGSFLHNSSVEMFERHGFERTRQLGKHAWVVTRRVN